MNTWDKPCAYGQDAHDFEPLHLTPDVIRYPTTHVAVCRKCGALR